MSNALVEEFKESSREFSIRYSQHALQILSKSLYSRPIEAIVRELVANAYDSHLAAGQEKQFQLFIERHPQDCYYMFRIRDYGTGMAPEDLERLYCTYFDSTKDSDDGMIGAFGLGSKSPFAFTREYYINTYWYGIKTSYKASVDINTNMPSLHRLSCEDVGYDVDNGVEIYFDITGRTADFADAIRLILCNFVDVAEYYFDTAKMHVPAPDYILKLPHVSFFSFTGNDNKYVILNRVRYRLDKLAVHAAFSGASFVLKVGGGIDVTPSREELHYNDSTVHALDAVFELALKEMYDHVDRLISAHVEPLDLRQEYQGLADTMPTFVPHVYERDGIEYRADNKYSLDGLKLNAAEWQYVTKVWRGSRGKLRSIPLKSYSYNRDGKYFFAYIPRGEKLSKSWITEWLKANPYQRLWVFGSLEEFVRFRNALYLPGTTPIVQAGTLGKRTPGISRETFFSYTPSRQCGKCWEPVEVDLSKESDAIYVPLMYWKPCWNGCHVSNPTEFLGCLKKASGESTIYGIRLGQLNKVKSRSGWRNAFDVLHQAGEQLVPEFEGKSIFEYHPCWLRVLVDLKISEWGSDIPTVAKTLQLIEQTDKASRAYRKYQVLCSYSTGLLRKKVDCIDAKDCPLLIDFPMLKYYLNHTSRDGVQAEDRVIIENYLRERNGRR